MFIDPHKRLASVQKLLDAVSTSDTEDSGTQSGEDRALLALRPLGLRMSDAKTAAFVAGAFDMTAYLVEVHSKTLGISKEELVARIRHGVLPLAYSDVWGDPQS